LHAAPSVVWRDRFHLERRTLAQLNHPRIVHLLDGGDLENGMPYLVMEYVDGQNIMAFAESQRLTRGQRLELFLQLAETISYAHRQLWVHCDLKPANILVDRQGHLKLCDFGIAQTLSQLSESSVFRGFSPGYASPEQLKGERCTAATDIYALGLILLELLTGHQPFAGLDDEIPGLLAQRMDWKLPKQGLTGQPILDLILDKMLRPEPEARYGSVDALIQDLNAYRENRPIQLKTGRRLYRAGCFLRRNRLWFVPTLLAIFILCAALVWTSLMQLRLQAAVADLKRVQAKNEEVISFLTGMFEGATFSGGYRKDMSAVELVDRAISRAVLEIKTPEVQAALTPIFQTILFQLGQYQQVIDLGEKRLPDPTHFPEEWLSSKVLMADGFFSNGHLEEAQALLDQLGQLELSDPQTLKWRGSLISLAMNRADYAKAQALLDEQGHLIEKMGLDRSVEHVYLLGNRARLAFEQGQYDQAMGLYQHELDLLAQLEKPEPQQRVRVLTDLASCYGRVRPDQAEAAYLQALEAGQALYGPNHYEIMILHLNLGNFLLRQKVIDRAQSHLAQAKVIAATLGGDADFVKPHIESSLASPLKFTYPEHALALLESAQQGFETTDRAGHPLCLMAQIEARFECALLGNAADEIPEMEALICSVEQVVGPNHAMAQAAGRLLAWTEMLAELNP
ncbi:MAG: serine/threonine protein kinase, partial [Acidobacteria bacterium]|nr:serine/threonine protein kinase [Acidobacteriota bacterium]